MRWFWIDRFTEFVSGQRATSIKNVSLSEEQLHDHFPGAPYMPSSLVTEGIAQCGGLLVGEMSGFNDRVVLAKISKITFHFHLVPGDSMVIETRIEDVSADGARVSATTKLGDRLHAEADLFFAFLGGRSEDRELFEPAELLCMLRLLGMYDVGRKPDGSKLEVPPWMLEAERIANAGQ